MPSSDLVVCCLCFAACLCFIYPGSPFVVPACSCITFPFSFSPSTLPPSSGNSVYAYLSSCRSTHFDANALICFCFSALREFALISFCYFAIYLSPPLSVFLPLPLCFSLCLRQCSRPGRQTGREICADIAYIYRRLHLSCQKSLTKLNLLPPVALSLSLVSSPSLYLSLSLSVRLSVSRF